jgi:hypothetical protein
MYIKGPFIMLRVTNVFQRPSVDVLFHNANMTPEFFEHVKTTYKDTNKAVNIQVSKSDDLLTMTTVWVWNTPEDYAEYRADPAVQDWIATRDAHNLANGIVQVPKLVENI